VGVADETYNFIFCLAETLMRFTNWSSTCHKMLTSNAETSLKLSDRFTVTTQLK